MKQARGTTTENDVDTSGRADIGAEAAARNAERLTISQRARRMACTVITAAGATLGMQ